MMTCSGTCPVNACSVSTPNGVDTAISNFIDTILEAGAVVNSSSLTFSSGTVTGFTATLDVTPNGQEVAIATAQVACVAELSLLGHVGTWS